MRVRASTALSTPLLQLLCVAACVWVACASLASCASAGAAAAAAAAAPFPASSCSGVANAVPIVDFDPSSAKVLGQVANGILQSVLPNNSDTPLLVLHVYGDDYAQGVAYGQLLAEQLALMVPQTYDYFSSKYGIPRADVNALLDLTCNSTKDFTPKHHFLFMQGVADGSKGAVSFEDFWRLAMIPEAIKATCSIMGAWGASTATGGLLQLRALDWGTDGPFQQWPLLATFHQVDGSFTFSNLGWVGMYGTLTGFSSSHMAVSEKVWYEYAGLDNILGYPWTLMLHDIMRFDSDIDQALSRIGGATRTCAIWLGLGQGARPNPRDNNKTLPADFKLVGDSFQELHIYNPENFPIDSFRSGAHDYFPDLLFVDRHVQPSNNTCFNELVHGLYGSFDAVSVFQTLAPLAQTGDMHIAVTDFDENHIYIANASPMPTHTPAYNNGFVKVNSQALWQQRQPSRNEERHASISLF